jgi:ribosome-associated protein
MEEKIEIEGVPVRTGFVIPLAELHFSFIRASGPGGQKVNKTATKVRLKWWPEESPAIRNALSPAEQERLLRRAKKHEADDGAIQFVSEQFRSREANREACCKKLAERIRGWLRKPKKRIPTSPSRASKERRLKEKKQRSRTKKDRQQPGGNG